MPKASSSSSIDRCARTASSILSLGKIMPSLYSHYAKAGLVYIALASPSSRQPSSCLECTKVNVRSSCDVRSVSNAKYTRPITFNSLRVP